MERVVNSIFRKTNETEQTGKQRNALHTESAAASSHWLCCAHEVSVKGRNGERRGPLSAPLHALSHTHTWSCHSSAETRGDPLAWQ